MRPKVEIGSGINFARSSYVFVLRGVFPSRLPADEPLRAAAVIVDAHSRLVGLRNEGFCAAPEEMSRSVTNINKQRV